MFRRNRRTVVVALAVVGLIAGVAGGRLAAPGDGSPAGSAPAPSEFESAAAPRLVVGGRISNRDPVPWSAIDWRKIDRPFGARAAPGHDRLDGLVAGGPGLMGLGRVHQPGRNQFDDMGAIYLSADGVAWAVVPVDAGVGGADGSELHLVADGPAGIVVVGGVCCTGEERPVLWRSPDGRSWTRLPWPEAFGGESQIMGLAATQTGYAAGGTLDGLATIWTSPDGAAWTRVDDPGAGLGPGGVNDVEPTADGFVAVGWLDVGGTSDGAIWVSRTDETWKRVAADVLTGPLETTTQRVVPWAGGWFVVGQEGTHEERIACEQAGRVASIPEPALPRPLTHDFSCGWGVETHWLSADGAVWRRDVPIGARNQAVIPEGALIEFRLLAAGGPGLVALGEGSGVGAASIFVSDDGITWRPTAPIAQFPVGIVPNGFVVAGRAIAAVGDGPSAWLGAVR